MAAPSSTVNTTPNIRRSVTLPTRLAGSPNISADSVKNNGSQEIETLFVHSNARILNFRTSSHTPRGHGKRDAHQVYTSAETEVPGTLPWRSPTERMIATGPIRIYRVPGSVAFLNAGISFLKPVLAKSQCWCVDGETIFVLKRAPHDFYRIELPNQGDSDLQKAAEFADALRQILRYEKTPCPFQRGFHVDLPESPQITYVPWKPKHRPISPIYRSTGSSPAESPSRSKQSPTRGRSLKGASLSSEEREIVDAAEERAQSSILGFSERPRSSSNHQSIKPTIGKYETLDQDHERDRILSQGRRDATEIALLSSSAQRASLNLTETSIQIQTELMSHEISGEDQAHRDFSASPRAGAEKAQDGDKSPKNEIGSNHQFSIETESEQAESHRQHFDDSKVNTRGRDQPDASEFETSTAGLNSASTQVPRISSNSTDYTSESYQDLTEGLSSLQENTNNASSRPNHEAHYSQQSYQTLTECGDSVNDAREGSLISATSELRSKRVVSFPESEASSSSPIILDPLTVKQPLMADSGRADLLRTHIDTLAVHSNECESSTNGNGSPNFEDEIHGEAHVGDGSLVLDVHSNEHGSSVSDFRLPHFPDQPEPDTPFWHSFAESPTSQQDPVIETVKRTKTIEGEATPSVPAIETEVNQPPSHCSSETTRSPIKLHPKTASMPHQRSQSRSPLPKKASMHFSQSSYEQVGAVIGEKMAGMLLGPPLKLAALMLQIAAKFANGVRIRDEDGIGWKRRGEQGRKLPGTWQYYSEDEGEMEYDSDIDYGFDDFGIE